MRYQSGRYISTSEAVWHILSFHIHERFPPVKDGQRVYFDHNNVTERVENPRNTKLMAYLKLRQEDIFAITLLYENTITCWTSYLKCLFRINYFTSKNFRSQKSILQRF